MVMIVPARTNSEWFAVYALKAAEFRFVTGWLFRQFNRTVVLIFRQHRGPVRVSMMSAR